MLQPNDPDLLINKGNALYHTANYSGAVKYYDKALAAFADAGSGSNQSSNTGNSTISVKINKADALFHLGNYSDAVKYYNEALSAAPNDIAAQKGKMLSEREIQKYR
jgi:tetratricopeptide (TPR) repeat protein